ncbi:heme exporter protein D [Pseudoduganella flava]|uniref:Heme exporter protein D n=1 Tax=Pseudoduganella flava TaxID=871742 RepID=A0A562PNS1_9BURK|nr:heme exporter protein CcmD [Pseudoduganella flava]QGZ40659.1 heme exporter protein CcmD [Pseudoduganella flava]TWI46112.1 heme exporter protein D [Pseudoduganella flava]
MNWQSFGEFLHMGGYALYVWGACAMVAAALASEVMLVRRRLRLARRGAAR